MDSYRFWGIGMVLDTYSPEIHTENVEGRAENGKGMQKRRSQQRREIHQYLVDRYSSIARHSIPVGSTRTHVGFWDE